MALLTVQSISGVSITPTYAAVAASDTIVPLEDMFLHVKNVSGTNDTVTIVIPGNDQFGSAIPDPTVTVPLTTGDRMIVITPQMADPATGLVTVTHSQTASVTCALFVR